MSSLAAIGEERLGQYDAVRKEQLSELDREIGRPEIRFTVMEEAARQFREVRSVQA